MAKFPKASCFWLASSAILPQTSKYNPTIHGGIIAASICSRHYADMDLGGIPSIPKSRAYLRKHHHQEQSRKAVYKA